MIQQHETDAQTTARVSAGANVSLENILVVTDFSETSERALEHALSLARPDQESSALPRVRVDLTGSLGLPRGTVSLPLHPAK
jgi:hypothetical protein